MAAPVTQSLLAAREFAAQCMADFLADGGECAETYGRDLAWSDVQVRWEFESLAFAAEATPAMEMLMREYEACLDERGMLATMSNN